MTGAKPRPSHERQAGLTLIEVVIVLALTLAIASIVYQLTRSTWLFYRVQTHATERGFSALRSLDDMTVEIARAGFGLGRDAQPLFPGTLEGARAPDAITLRSNPGGVAARLKEDLEDRDRLVAAEGAALFAPGDEVLLADAERATERAVVTRVEGDALALRSREGPDGRLQRPFLTSLGARVLKVREVGFYLKTDAGGTTVLARKATGQAEQTLARYVDELRFEYVDEAGLPMDPSRIRGGNVPGGVWISLSLQPNPGLPPVVVAPLRLLVALPAQSAAVAFDAAGYRLVGVSAVVGQDPASARMTVRMHAWRADRPLP
jgi:prepilin-type N-terminal cleavage/methylation domain-containing protein